MSPPDDLDSAPREPVIQARGLTRFFGARCAVGHRVAARGAAALAHPANHQLRSGRGIGRT